MEYDRDGAVWYALTYALQHNPAYVYYDGADCSNFISQCLRAGGAQDDYNPTHPWWYRGGQGSVCWSVAASLYWYIRTRTQQNGFGIKAQTVELNGYHNYDQVRGIIQPGDLIQYRDGGGAIRHSTLITGFDGNGEPLISQHSRDAVNISWRKPFPQPIFHHITSIN